MRRRGENTAKRGARLIDRRALFFRLLPAALALEFFSGCGALSTVPQSDLARTWEQGRIYFPHAPAHVAPAAAEAPGRLATVLLLHDCAGIDDGVERWARTLAAAGYAAAVPDSFARPGRSSDCDAETMTGGRFPQAERMRAEEIHYALVKLRSAAWADPRNLFLMGQGEGGRAAARWSGTGFKAVIVSASRCPDGLRAPLDVPVLALTYERDPWARGIQSACAKGFAGRAQASELRLPGSGHDTSNSTEAQRAALTFLRYHTSP